MVDYVGIGHHIRQAIDAYDEREQKNIVDALSFPEDELRELEVSFGAIMDLLKKHRLDDLSDHDAFLRRLLRLKTCASSSCRRSGS